MIRLDIEYGRRRNLLLESRNYFQNAPGAVVSNAGHSKEKKFWPRKKSKLSNHRLLFPGAS